MSSVMNMGQFRIKLCGPTSTSKQISVAARFGGQKGFLIEFDNSKDWGKHVEGFDVSWLSRYGSQEDERYNYFFFFVVIIPVYTHTIQIFHGLCR